MQENAQGNFDVFCGTTLVTTLPVGGLGPQGPAGPAGPQGPQGPQGIPGEFAGQGLPGVGCTGETVAPSATNAGGVNITCANGTFFVANGSGGGVGGPTGDCALTAVDVPPPPAGGQLYGDKGINIRCVDNRSATILVCPAVPTTAPNGSTGLLFNTDGQVGRCTAQGLIIRSEQAVLQCGGGMFDPKKEFCQRTLNKRKSAATSENDSGWFATYNKSTGDVSSITAYPGNSYTNITDPESNYNLAGNHPDVKSVVLPLCGVEATTSSNQTTIAQNHRIGTGGGKNTASGVTPPPTVYNALQYCGRNLVFKLGDATTGNISATGSNGKPVKGGSLDNNPSNPFSDAWSVQTNGQCYIGLKETNAEGVNQAGSTGFGINGFTFGSTSTNASANASAGCTFFGVTPVGTPPYTTCPESAPLVSLDDVGCVARSSCLYHSTIDNTCLVGKQAASLFGKSAYDSAYVTATYSGGAFTTITAKFVSGGDNATRGIFRTALGSRDGRGQNPYATLEREGNMWSTPCVTLTASRLGFYAVNDPYLTNKKFKDDWANKLASATSTITDEPVPPPVCGGTNLQGETVAAIPFDDAFACLQGDLSVYLPATAGTNDGNAWNRPIYCVQSGLQGINTSGQRCYLSGVTEEQCTTGEKVSKIFAGNTEITTINSTAITPGSIISAWSEGEGACRVMTDADPTAAVSITSAVCGTITGATLPETTPIVATTWDKDGIEFGALGATTSGLIGTWTADNKCVLSGNFTTPTGTINPPTGPIFVKANCNITRVRQGGGTELAAQGFWNDNAGTAALNWESSTLTQYTWTDNTSWQANVWAQNTWTQNTWNSTDSECTSDSQYDGDETACTSKGTCSNGDTDVDETTCKSTGKCNGTGDVSSASCPATSGTCNDGSTNITETACKAKGTCQNAAYNGDQSACTAKGICSNGDANVDNATCTATSYCKACVGGDCTASPTIQADCNGSSPVQRCEVTLRSNASLASICNSLDLVRANSVNTGARSDVTAEWK